MLKDMQELMVYDKKRTDRKQKIYAFTPLGFLNVFGNSEAKAKADFKKVMKIWLAQEKFDFFLPKQEVAAKIDIEEVERSLAEFCQLISDFLPLAHDVSDYLSELGYENPGSSQIIDFAANLASSTQPKEFLQLTRILARHLPTYRQEILRFTERVEQWSAMLRKQIEEAPS